MSSDEATGLPLLVEHAATLVASLLLLLLWTALGTRVRRLVSRDASIERVATRWVLDTGLGLGLLGTLYLLLAAMGLLRPSVVIATATLLATGCLVTWRRSSSGYPAGATTGEPMKIEDGVLFLLMGGTCLLTLLGALAPATDWDSLMYHLRVPAQLLEAGRLIVPPDNLHVALVGIAHFATLPLLSLGLESGPAVMQALLLAGTVIATVELARAAGLGRQAAWLAGAILLGAPAFFLVALTARVDVVLTFLLVSAHLALLQARSGSRETVLLGAILLGVAVAIKPQAGAYALALAPLGWVAAGSARQALAAGALAVAIAIPWYLKNLILVEAPLYPLGGLTRLQPWLAALLSSTTVPAGMDTRILEVLSASRAPFNLWDAFVAPHRVTIEEEGRHYFMSPLLLLIPLLAVGWRRRPAVAGILVTALAYLLFIVLPFGEINLRYLMPAVPGLSIAAAATAFMIIDRLPSPWVRRVVLAAIVFVGSWHLVRTLESRLGGEAILLRHAFGTSSAGAVLYLHPDLSARQLAPMVDAVRRAVPEHGRVLMLWESRGQAFDRDVLADVMLTNWSWLAQSDALEDCLAGAGVTHVLVHLAAVQYYVGRGAEAEAFRLGDFERFAARCLVPGPVQAGGHLLFAVQPPGAGA